MFTSYCFIKLTNQTNGNNYFLVGRIMAHKERLPITEKDVMVNPSCGWTEYSLTPPVIPQ